MSEISIETIENSKIRKVWDEDNSLWQYSIVDTIGLLTNSSDPRNYWKVLKSRLKNTYPELVTQCNQLKMRSNDGKYYNTDSASGTSLIRIVEVISPENTDAFMSWISKNEHQRSLDTIIKTDETQKINQHTLEVKVQIEKFKNKVIPSPVTGKIKIDGYVKNKEIILVIDTAGCDPDELFLTTKINELTIKGTRLNKYEEHVLYKNLSELTWGQFARIIKLPLDVDIESARAEFTNGLLKVSLKTLNKEESKIIKIKPLG
jgi:HSP20 family molecular chaperone IbpA